MVGVETEIPNKQIRLLILLMSHLGMPDRYKGNIYYLPSEVYDPVQAFLPESSMAWFDEKVEAPNTLAQAGRYETLGDFPLIVMSASDPPSIAQGQKIQDVWLELQQDLLRLSENSELRITEVGYYPQLQKPNWVIEAIQDVLGRCRQTSPTP